MFGDRAATLCYYEPLLGGVYLYAGFRDKLKTQRGFL